MRVDLNADLGESYGAWAMGADAELLPLITSANVACGFHAGDPQVIAQTVALAKRFGVRVGAHPGYPDRQGFGRRAMGLSPAEIRTDLLYQIGAVAAFCRAEGVPLHHVKPHGALYNRAAVDGGAAEAIAAAIWSFDPGLILYAPPGSQLQKAGEARGLTVWCEVFADRGYRADGTLVPRDQPGALIEDAAKAESQVLQMITEGTVTAVTGERVPVRAQTICLHGDGAHALAFARRLRERLTAAGLLG
ncbi:MAG TPA: 5-oxoprolinase subunit PxpA [Symbiobacteriaceae bacterium]|nr:5-oxoprolinase subunit PxpA [Symbiobacteriaceae bacterium]